MLSWLWIHIYHTDRNDTDLLVHLSATRANSLWFQSSSTIRIEGIWKGRLNISFALHQSGTGRAPIRDFCLVDLSLTLAWWRSTPYMDSFLAFSRKCISAAAGVIPLDRADGTKSVGRDTFSRNVFWPRPETRKPKKIQRGTIHFNCIKASRTWAGRCFWPATLSASIWSRDGLSRERESPNPFHCLAA